MAYLSTVFRSSGGQAQTQIRVDEVLFAQNTAGSPAGDEAFTAIDATRKILTVASITDFEAGDYVKITVGTATVYRNVESVDAGDPDAVPPVSPTITVDVALPGTATTGSLLEVSADGMKISIRNTGFVPATIQTIYLYKGDAQILKKDSIGVAIPAGDLYEFGLKDTGADWDELLPDLGSQPTHYFEVTYASDLVVASGYSIKVVTDTGFTVEGTYYTPSAFA